MPFGLSPDRYKKIKSVFPHFPSVEEVLLFGSRALDTYKESSDLDFALKGDKVTAKEILHLRSALDELPYGYTYDIVDYKTIKKKEFKEHIDEFGIPFYKKELKPKSWRDFHLNDLGIVLNHLRIPLNSQQRKNRPGKYPYYGASGIVDYIDDFLFEGEHVLISEDGENLRSRKTPIAFKVNGKFWVNNHAHIFKGNKDWINDFVVYYFQNSDINAFITGAAQPKLNKENLLSIPISFPKEHVGEKIASILSSLDDKIELNLQMNATLENIAQAIFKEWFINFNFPGFNGTLVDGLPEGWKKGNLGDVVDLNKQTVSPSENPDKYYLHYSLPAFDEGVLPRLEMGKTILSNKFVVDKPSILLSKLNPRFPRIWSILSPEKDSICSTEFLVLTPKTKDYFSFIFSLLNVSTVQDEMIGLASGTSGSHQRVRPDDVLDIGVTIPDEDLVKEFNTIVITLIRRKVENILQNHTLMQLRDNLLPKLMSGKIQVPA